MDKSSSSGGIGFSSVLFIVFLVLKLTGTITWSWWWVTAPIWLPASVCLTVALVLVSIAGIMLIIERN